MINRVLIFLTNSRRRPQEYDRSRDLHGAGRKGCHRCNVSNQPHQGDRVKKILITGATGFIGIEVSRQLAARGAVPRLMVRRPIRGLMLRNLDAEIMQADIRSPKSLDRILEGIDAVIHLGARAAFEPYPKLYPSIVRGSLNLMRAAIKARIRTFVYGGSLLVYGDSSRPIDQNTPPRPMSGYGRASPVSRQRSTGLSA